MRLLLIRHGQTPSNVGRHLDTAIPGPGLTELGLEQAEALPRVLADERIEALYASPLVRTQLTAAPLAEALGLPVVVRAGLREIEAGDLEMRNDDSSIDTYISTVLAWADGETERRIPGSVSRAEFLARFDEVITEVAATVVGTAAVVGHSAAIRIWTAARAENTDTGFAAGHDLPNGAVVVLEGAPGQGWKALSWAGHPLGG